MPRNVRTTAQRRAAPPLYDPSPEAQTAYADLNHRLLLARERGEVVPCLGKESALWQSQHPDEQDRAADSCYDCPAMLLCKQYADLADEYIGTWGGVTRDPAQPVSRRPETVARRARKRPAGGRDCSCGCGGWTKGGRYLPGHDSQHLARLIRYVRGGGMTEERALRALAESPGLQAKLLVKVRR